MVLPFDPIDEARRNWASNGFGAIDAMSAATSLTRAHQIVLGRVNDALAPHGLTFSRYEAIALLAFSRKGELPLGKMGVRLQVHPASITNTVDRLEADGLVERTPHATDRRTVLARITEAGRQRLKEATEALVEIEFGLSVLSPRQRASLDATLRPLRHDAGDF